MTEASDKAPTESDQSPEDPLTGHEYDGIQEYDNPLPRWWKNIFWGSFAFSIVYIFYYHLTPHGDGVVEAYQADMRQAREERAKQMLGKEASEEGLAKLMADASMMTDAAVIYTKNCRPCHDEQGKGNIGPNLTDDHWIHGEGQLMDIYQVVHDGVPSKGMTPWGPILTPIELQKVVAYIGTLRGKNLPGKAPEGNKVAQK